MSKVSNAIKMLNVLSSRSVVSKEELSNILETNIRNIPIYKKELEDAGYEIMAIHGKFGGYLLNKDKTIKNPLLTESEKETIKEASLYLNNRYDFLKKDEYNVAIGKVLSSFHSSDLDDEPLIIDRFPLAMNEVEIKKRYVFIMDCIKNMNKMEIEYLSSKNVLKKHIIHPYKLYMYNLAWYVLAFNESICDIGYFKINRIETFKKINCTFKVMKTYNEANYLDKFGMKNNGEYIDVKIELKNPYAALVRERIYGKNQTLQFIDDNTTILSCKMQNLDNIVAFVLGCGSKARVISPDILKDRVKAEIKKLYELYE